MRNAIEWNHLKASAFKTIRCTLIRFNYIFFGSFIVMFFQLPKIMFVFKLVFKLLIRLVL